jgi:hypothetical protein
MNAAGANAITPITTTSRIEIPPCPRLGRVVIVVAVELELELELECLEPTWQHRV